MTDSQAYAVKAIAEVVNDSFITAWADSTKLEFWRAKLEEAHEAGERVGQVKGFARATKKETASEERTQ